MSYDPTYTSQLSAAVSALRHRMMFERTVFGLTIGALVVIILFKAMHVI